MLRIMRHLLAAGVFIVSLSAAAAARSPHSSFTPPPIGALWKKIKPSSDIFEYLRQRLSQIVIARTDPALAASYLQSLDKSGRWHDIDYTVAPQAEWPSIFHLWRLVTMSVAYHAPDHPLQGSPALLQGIHSALQYWYGLRHAPGNWWWLQIGQQRELASILLLMQPQLPAQMVEKGSSYFLDPTQVSSSVTTGQNLIWFASEGVHRGVLRRSREDIVRNLKYINDVIIVTTKEGVQADFSFHQHGPQLYNAGYGYDFVVDIIQWLGATHQTEFAFDPSKVEIMSRLLMDGTAWMLRGPNFDFNASGREVARIEFANRTVNFLPICDILAELIPARKPALMQIKQAITAQDGNSSAVNGNKHFWRSDYMVQQQSNYFVSLKMVSSRTTGTEMLNGENTQGYWLPFGLTGIQRTGTEYYEIFPVWNWTKLPGITSPAWVEPMPVSQKQNELFVGGATSGQTGVAALNMNKLNTTALKSWFFFKNLFVAMGTGISSGRDETITTTMNQTLLRGNVVADGMILTPPLSAREAYHWVWHDNVGYIFPDAAEVNLKAQTQTGSWHDINTRYPADTFSRDVFTLWLDHGAHPDQESYLYTVCPGCTIDETATLADNSSVELIAQTDAVHAVRHTGEKITGLVLRTPGTVVLGPSHTVTVDQPCLMLIDESSRATVKISVADPTQQLRQLKVTYAKNGSEQTLNFALPSQEYAGSTLTQVINLTAQRRIQQRQPQQHPRPRPR
jgi:chondroitin AC lyase